ncbi:MAG: hypothetical protein OXJ52_09470, partial [Oligoflexia bacterium]|nr:hypothetical protein [Oligoflexia bacterium]
MSQLKMHEKKLFEKLFDRGGYVLDFNDRTFVEFFRDHGINIEKEKYRFNGRSKMKRLRAFWEIESDNVVGKVLQSLLEYACVVEAVNPNEKKIANSIINKLQGESPEQKTEKVIESEFLKREFTDISLQKLELDSVITEVLQQRINEIEKCLKSKSALATIFLCGSALEGILFGVATNNPEIFNSANASPKNKNGKVLQFQNWTLSNFIDVSKEVSFLNEDVKKFSHALRDFRNYIHPYEQANQQFNP